MNQWYVKDLSKITQISVQTLHHYDRIDLLKPSIRLPNGYRLYSETDLLRLQQIIALKFFGFGLSQIKNLLEGNVDITEHFLVQSQLLENKAKTLQEASQTLKNILANCSDDKSIPWETIIQLIEVYRMTQQLEKTWVGKVFNSEELKEYASFQAGLKNKYTENQKKVFEEKWINLITEIRENLDKDPKSKFGTTIAKRCMDMINSLYGKEHAHLKRAIWEKGFKKGHMDEEHFVTPEIVTWLDKAIDTYYRERIFKILDQVTSKVSTALLQEWNNLMEEMYGDTEALKQDLIKVALAEDRVSREAKEWLQKLKS